MRNRNFKAIAVLLTAAIFMATMTACSDGNKSSSMDESNQTNAQSTKENDDSNSEADDVSDVSIEYNLGDELPQEIIDISRINKGNEVRLSKFFKKLENNEEVTVGFIGGSVTQGDSAGAKLCYANQTVEWIKAKYPSATVNYVNAGIGATGSYIGVHRVDEDLLASKPDLVFVEFSVNDYTDFTERNKESYDGLMRKIWLSESAPAVIALGLTQDNGTTFLSQHKVVCDAYEIPMISYRDAIFELINKAGINWTDISNDNIHPNVAGHDILTKLITAYLGEVAERADTITGEEPDIVTTPAVSGRFVNARILRANDLQPTEQNGFKQIKDMEIGKFIGVWSAAAKDGKFEDASIKFEVEAKNIALLHSKIVNKGAKVIVKVDGEEVVEIDGNFVNGWGDYAYATEIKAFDTQGKHTVEIIPQVAEDFSGIQVFYIAGLLVS